MYLCRGHELEKELLYGLAQYEKVAESLEKVVMVNTPYHHLVHPAKVATGEGEADPASRAKRGLDVPLRSVRAEAAALLASAQAIAAEADAPPLPDKPDKPLAKGGPAKKRLPAAKPEEAASSPKKKPKVEGGRLSVSAAATLHAELAKLRAGTRMPAL